MLVKDKVVAILVADIHLCHSPPVARALEPDWYAAMQRSLDEIRALSIQYDDVPILCAGDVFDRWNSNAALINFAIRNVPKMHAIPGQHDLPLHRYDMMDRSAFDTLQLAGVLNVLEPGVFTLVSDGIHVQGFPWGTPVEPLRAEFRSWPGLKVALVHSFLWLDKSTSYPGAPETGQVSEAKKNMEGWDVVVFGDNHRGFLVEDDDLSILNCGTVFRRRSNELDYVPKVGLLRSSGKIDMHSLDISKDVLTVLEDADWEPSGDLSEFVGSLSRMGGDPLDFRDAMGKLTSECDGGVRDILVEVMSEEQK